MSRAIVQFSWLFSGAAYQGLNWSKNLCLKLWLELQYSFVFLMVMDAGWLEVHSLPWSKRALNSGTARILMRSEATLQLACVSLRFIMAALLQASVALSAQCIWTGISPSSDALFRTPLQFRSASCFFGENLRRNPDLSSWRSLFGHC